MGTDTRHVLIVTQNFPPTNEIAARRFGCLVPYIEQHGWTPWVLTTPGAGPLPVRIPPERVYRIGRNSNRLPATLSEVRRGTPPSSPLGRMRTAARSAARWVVERTGSRVYSLYPANLEWHRKVVSAREAIRRWLPPIEIVIGSFLPAGALLIAARLAAMRGVPWLADIRDMASQIPGRRNPLARLVDRWVERRLFRTAAGFLTVSPTLAHMLESTHGRPAAVIYNGWDPAGETGNGAAAGPEIPGSPRPAWGGAAAGPCPSQPAPQPLYYAGMLYAHQMGAAELILDAMVRLPAVRWNLRSLGPAALERRLLESARCRGLGERVEIHAPCDPQVVARECEQAGANVVLENLDTRHQAGRGTLTGKFLKLLPHTPPVLAVARADSDIGPILVRTGKGRLCSTSDAVADFLDSVARHPHHYRGHAAAIAEFSTQAQAAALARVLCERTTAGP